MSSTRALPSLNETDNLLNWHETLAALRSSDPVHWDDGIESWVVTSYSAVRGALYNKDLSSRGPTAFMELLGENDRRSFAELQRFYEKWMVFSDSPYHEQVRTCVQRLLTPRAVEWRRDHVRAEIARLADEAAGRDVDLHFGFARPLAVKIICDILDVSMDRWDEFSAWSGALISFISAPRPDVGQATVALESYRAMAEYVRTVAAELKRAGRTENPIVAVEELGEPAMVATFAQFLTGGCDPISVGLANTIAVLLERPDQLRRIREDPTLIDSSVQECLRYETPFTLTPRVVIRETDVGPRRLAAGERVMLMLAAANRDPEVFDEPDVLDVGRDPNPHLAFGVGPHYCIGAGLARVEMSETVATLAARDSGWRLRKPVGWVPSLGVRSVSEVPAHVGD